MIWYLQQQSIPSFMICITSIFKFWYPPVQPLGPFLNKRSFWHHQSFYSILPEVAVHHDDIRVVELKVWAVTLIVQNPQNDHQFLRISFFKGIFYCSIVLRVVSHWIVLFLFNLNCYNWGKNESYLWSLFLEGWGRVFKRFLTTWNWQNKCTRLKKSIDDRPFRGNMNTKFYYPLLGAWLSVFEWSIT